MKPDDEEKRTIESIDKDETDMNNGALGGSIVTIGNAAPDEDAQELSKNNAAK